MTISEKIIHSDCFAVNLYKEGIFWVAYNQSAFALQSVKALKATRKYVKTVQSEVVSVGFPDATLPFILTHFEVVEQMATHIKAKLAIDIDMISYTEWVEALPLVERNGNKEIQKSSGEAVDCVLDKIRCFPLANSTPIDCFQFVSYLQQVVAN